MSPSPTDHRRPIEREPADALIAHFAPSRRWSDSSAPKPVATWRELTQSGLLAAAIPVEHGGLGGSPRQIMPLMRELGRHLIAEPFIPTAVMTVKLLQEAGSPTQQATLLPDIAAGVLKFAFALAESERDSRALIGTTARRIDSGDCYLISGRKTGVRHASRVNKLIVTARTQGSDGITVFIVDSKAPGLHRTDYHAPDGQPASDLEFDGVRVSSSAIIGALHNGLAAVERAHCYGTIAHAAETLGTMDALIDLIEKRLYRNGGSDHPAVHYAGAQERLTQMKLARDRSQTLLHAVKAYLSGSPATPAKRTTLGAEARLIASHAIYLHGVQGLADGASVRAYFKRLMSSDLDFDLGKRPHGGRDRGAQNARPTLRASGAEYAARATTT